MLALARVSLLPGAVETAREMANAQQPGGSVVSDLGYAVAEASWIRTSSWPWF
jgi:hypothetical protein